MTGRQHVKTCLNSHLINECALSNVFSCSLAFKAFIYAELRLSLWGF